MVLYDTVGTRVNPQKHDPIDVTVSLCARAAAFPTLGSGQCPPKSMSTTHSSLDTV